VWRCIFSVRPRDLTWGCEVELVIELTLESEFVSNVLEIGLRKSDSCLVFLLIILLVLVELVKLVEFFFLMLIVRVKFDE